MSFGTSRPAREQFNERGLNLISGLFPEIASVWHCGPGHNDYAFFFTYLKHLLNEDSEILYYDDIQIKFTNREEDQILRALKKVDGTWVTESLWMPDEIKKAVDETKNAVENKDLRDYTKEPYPYGPFGMFPQSGSK